MKLQFLNDMKRGTNIWIEYFQTVKQWVRSSYELPLLMFVETAGCPKIEEVPIHTKVYKTN